MCVEGYIHSTETFGSVDGPGIRFIIFTQGCAMRCAYCHNADTWSMQDGQRVSSDELLKKALRYRTYWKKDGGITVSGGEPLLQIDFLLDLFEKAKKEGVHTVIDTSANPFTREEPFFSKFQALMKVTDLLLVDIKHIRNDQHQQLTKQPNQNILDMLQYLNDIKKPIWIRHVLVPTINDSEEDLQALDSFVKTLSNVKRFEVLPYHTLGAYKWDELGYDYLLKGIESPDEELLAHANEVLHTADYQDYQK